MGTLALGVPAAAQRTEVLETVERLDFDRPEAWAMKYFASVSLLTGLGAVEDREPGSVEAGFEVISVPHLDQRQRTVGFGGLKEEELNRSPVSGRGRVTVGLPWRSAFTLAWSPPLDIDGVEASLLSLALEKVLYAGEAWSLGARIFGQVGTAKGDFTCTAEDSRFPSGSPENAFGCEAASRDEVSLDYVGLEVVAGYRTASPKVPDFHFGTSVQHMDLEFQVNARTFGFLDRSLLLTDGETWAATAGATWALGRKGHLGLELFYSPLDVQRQGETSASDDGLFNLRALYRLRLR